MLKIKKNKKAEAWKLEVNEIDRQIRELLERKKQIQDEVEELRERKRELKKGNKKKRTLVWNEETPMIKLIHLDQLDRFKEMLNVWQEYCEEEIIVNTTSYFHFSTKNKHRIIAVLKKLLYSEIPVFNVSMEQVYLYLSQHSNLGKASAIKKAVQRKKTNL